MCTRQIILDASATGLKDLTYKMVRLCSIFGYVHETEDLNEDFRAVMAQDIPDDFNHSEVQDYALDLLNEHVKEGQGYEFDDNSLFLYHYCDNPADNDECMGS